MDDLDITLATEDDLADPIGLVAAAAYQWQGCQVLKYDRYRPEIFPQPYLADLYRRTGESGRSPMGGLPNLFCGMADLSMDAICKYLHDQGVYIIGEWRHNPSVIDPNDPLPENFEALTHPYFHPLGYFFVTGPVIRSRDSLSNALFAGYCFFQEAWRTPQQTVLMYLGLSYLFHEFSLVNIHGIRYADNKLTARFAGKFGFEDLGTIPNYMSKWPTGELTSMTVSTLARDVFEDKLRAVMLELRRPPE